ncbi:MAG TPA: MerR family transcriptional regulator [Pseudonocardiaceae bacterium]|jgi:DNA-binding transcriptional MerR regulator|nr:MerR family transcriptional regulator [Pseudonocardiaceae bacterium]
MPMDARWTIDELAQLVGRALAVGYPGQPSGRVREVPDRRTIRWYSTIGLLDRPAAMRGRTALYGQRHLRQLVAVKRLQADGRSIAQVQAALFGVDDGALAALAPLPADLLEPAEPVAEGDVRENGADRGRFWAQAAVVSSPVAPSPAAPSPAVAKPAEVVAGQDRPALVPSVVLGDGVRLLLDGAARLPDAEDLDAIGKAATALLDVLRERGLAEPMRQRSQGEN